MRKLFFVILACICLGIYWGYLNNGFVFDDKILVEDNPLIKCSRLLPNVFKTEIYEYWTGAQPYDRMYRPLQMFSYFLDYQLGGINPAVFRFTNLILHLFNSILVFYLIFLIFKNKLLAQATSILFLVHPVQISTVAYISSRGDLLSGFFILAGCILFLKFLDTSDYRLYCFSLLAAAFALLSRENALLIILYLMLLVWLKPNQKPRFKALAGFLVLGLGYLMIRFLVFGPSGLARHPAYLPGVLGLVNFGNIIFHYLLLFLWPHDLRMFHSTAFIYKLTVPILGLLVSGLVLWLLVLAAWNKNKKMPPVLKFSLFWFLLGMIPVYSYFDAYPVLGRALMAESWLYLPSIGFLAAFVYICLLSKKGKFIIAAWALVLGAMVFTNRVYWRNDVVFYERALKFLSDDSIIQKNLAAAYIRKGDFIRASRLIKKLEKYYPDSPVINSIQGQFYLAKGQPTQALEYFQRILGKSFLTDYFVSLCYSSLDNLSQAILFSQASLDLNPFYLPSIMQLATLYKNSGQTAQANKYIILANELNPKYRQPLFE
jgi:tetratricopeptide (TPR) repeat protein